MTHTLRKPKPLVRAIGVSLLLLLCLVPATASARLEMEIGAPEGDPTDGLDNDGGSSNGGTGLPLEDTITDGPIVPIPVVFRYPVPGASWSTGILLIPDFESVDRPATRWSFGRPGDVWRGGGS